MSTSSSMLIVKIPRTLLPYHFLSYSRAEVPQFFALTFKHIGNPNTLPHFPCYCLWILQWTLFYLLLPITSRDYSHSRSYQCSTHLLVVDMPSTLNKGLFKPPTNSQMPWPSIPSLTSLSTCNIRLLFYSHPVSLSTEHL